VLKDNRKSILSAALMVVIATMLLAYSTYAWFTVTRTVKAQGIELSVTTSNDIQISLTGGSDVTEWSDTVTINMKDVVKSQLPEFDTETFYLLPASSFSAFKDQIFTTTRAMTDGSAYADTVFNPAHTVVKNQEAYEGHYIDIPLFFRTGWDEDIAIYLIKEINGVVATYIIPVNNVSNIAKTVRVAFLNVDRNETSFGGDNTEPLVYANADHGNTPHVINDEDPNSEGGKLVSEYMTFNTDLNMSDKAVLNLTGADYSSGTVSYTVSEMIVRIWIEGQDSNCVAAIGGKSFSVGMGFAVAN